MRAVDHATGTMIFALAKRRRPPHRLPARVRVDYGQLSRNGRAELTVQAKWTAEIAVGGRVLTD